MIGLRRSVLVLRLHEGAPHPWPPPDADAVPDAVILEGAGSWDAGAGIAGVTEDVGRWGVECILDAPLDALAGLLHPGVTSVLCREPSVEQVRDADALLTELEGSRGFLAGALAIELFVGAPRAFLELDELLAASARVVSVITDPAALPDAFGVEASVEVDQFAYPRGWLVLAAAQRRIRAVGLFEPAGHHAGTAAAAGLDAARWSFAVGLHGGLCRTWDEVRACNRGFTPDPERVARARRIIEALAEAGRQGLGAISLDGRMIDLPFIAVSEATLRLAEQAAARHEAALQMFSTRM